MIYTDNSQQDQLNLTVLGADGQRVQAAILTCSIRPGRGFNLGMEMLVAPSQLAGGEDDKTYQEIAESAINFIFDELWKAADTGIPLDMDIAEGVAADDPEIAEALLRAGHAAEDAQADANADAGA